jgi:hypothetical protein
VVGESARFTRAYVSCLERASREAVPALARALELDRRAAGEAYAAAAGLVLAGLARARRDRAEDALLEGACGGSGDVESPELAIGAHLARRAPDPRLSLVLGDAAERAGPWLARRTGGAADTLSRAVSAAARTALCAASRAAGDVPAGALGEADEGALEAPERLAVGRDAGGNAYRSLRRAGLPWFERVLAV